MSRLPRWLLPVACFLLALGWALRPIWDIDVFWHIALGRHILAHGLPETDLFSAVDPTVPWRTFQGGYEVFVAWLDGLGGLGLVRLVHATAIAAGLTLMMRLARRVSGSDLVAIAFLALAMVLYEDRVRVRPHVFHLLFVALVLGVVVRAQPLRWRELLWLAPLSAVWASFHGPGWLWGVALLGAAAAGHARDWRGWARVGAFAGAGAVVPGVLSGIASASRVHTTGELQAQLVPEHWPLWAYPDAGLGLHGVLVPSLVTLLLALSMVVLVLDARQRRLRVGAGLTIAAVGTGLFSVLLARFAWYSLVPLLRTLASAREWQKGRTGRLAAIVACALSVGVLVVDWSVGVAPRYSGVAPWITDLQPRAFPVRAATVLERAGLEAEVFPDAAWGGYLLYRLFPQVRVLTDGRIAFPEEVGRLVVDFRPSRRAAILDEAHRRWGVDLAVLRAPAFPLSGVPVRWALLYRDEVAEVWAVRDERLPERSAAVVRASEELEQR